MAAELFPPCVRAGTEMQRADCGFAARLYGFGAQPLEFEHIHQFVQFAPACTVYDTPMAQSGLTGRMGSGKNDNHATASASSGL
ncbi:MULTISPECIES: hypothetical protein [unclassified Sinorhizobium]|uniref:hypothetical protein n=1 Tax=unclassified Sinorhizobium TaxID=2613772 RepID=UPI0024C4153E|nr:MULTISPECIES: hypothetical protein [unclassified Sinorhizobium]MDK1373231.1 hypothetical protein [Sinorhizobium sp. 6-70]MDK1480811.1 hypothetical protein [Sinorhizobium sp. 6-117]